MTRLRVDPSNERLLPHQGDDSRVYQHFLTTFGSDEDILVAFHDPQQSLLSPTGLAAVRHLTQALAELPHVAVVHSLTNAPDMTQLRLTPFGIAVPRLVPDENLTPEQVQAIQGNAQVIGTLLAPDLHTAGILIVPENVGTSASVRETWLTAVRAVAAQHAGRGRQTYVAGTPLERSDVTHYIQRDQRRIIPLVFLVLLVVTYSIYRVKRFAVLSMSCEVRSLIWTMGGACFVGMARNVIRPRLQP